MLGDPHVLCTEDAGLGDRGLIDTILTTWHGFGAETKGAAIGAVATILAAGLGALAIVLQIRRQGRLNRESIEENERRRLKSEMYEEVVDVCSAFSEVQGTFTGALMLVSQELNLAAMMHDDGRPSPLPRTRIMALNEHCSAYQTAIIRMLALIGQRKFVDPRLDIFATAFSCESEAVRDVFTRELFPFATRLLPVDRPDGAGIFPYQPPTMFQAQQVQALVERVRDHLHNSVGYALDFSVEMQNLLVGDLFDHAVPRREPIDPAIKVIRLDQADELDRYFREDTGWGKEIASRHGALRAAAAERGSVTGLPEVQCKPSLWRQIARRLKRF